MPDINLDELERLAKEQQFTTFTTQVDDPDFRYVAAACNAVPGLVARIRELERQRDWLAERLAFICRTHDDCVLECPKAIREIDCPDVTYERWIQAAKEAGE